MHEALRLLILARSNPAGVRSFLQAHPGVLESPVDMGNTPLHLAAGMGHHETVRLLLDCGARIEGENVLGRTPLHTACECGHARVVEVLLARGARTGAADRQERRPLHLAAASGGPEVVTMLLTLGAPVDPTDHLDFTPLFHALVVTPPHMAAQARAWSEKQRAGTNLPPVEPMDYGREDELRTRIVRLLLDAGAEIDHVGACGQTPLHRAAEVAHLCPGPYALLLERGADPGRLDSNGEPAANRLNRDLDVKR